MGYMGERTEEKVARKLAKKQKLVNVAAKRMKADLVLKNATYLNVFSSEFCVGDIAVSDGLIAGVGEYEGVREADVSGKFVCPGLIDAHIHLESSMVSPAEFARAVVRHGTTTVICDPHEIANVMGVDGIRYMMEATEGLPLDVHFMLPSCVPATDMDESGAKLDFRAIDEWFAHPRVLGLAEMMNYVGVTRADPFAISQILASQAHHKKIDGHAPGLSGAELNAYIAAGVYSDHECYTFENALEKLRLGQFIMIREGTAAKNLKALAPILTQARESRCMFATDDKHPIDLLTGGHIDYIIKEAIARGVDPVIAIKVASHNAARYFLLNNKGAIAPGYLADMVVFDDFRSFNVLQVFKRGREVFDGENVIMEQPKVEEGLSARAHDTFRAPFVTEERLAAGTLPMMGVKAHELITPNLGTADGYDAPRDVAKMALVERHHNTGHVGLGYVQGFGLKSGALASSISHDSHNVIAIGTCDRDLALAVNRILEMKGGVCVVDGGKVVAELSLPVAGIMSDEPLEAVNEKLERAKAVAYALGAQRGIDPFMTLSFMALPVIPHLKLTTHGMFDVDRWALA